jgi:hypothetical protein
LYHCISGPVILDVNNNKTINLKGLVQYLETNISLNVTTMQGNNAYNVNFVSFHKGNQ